MQAHCYWNQMDTTCDTKQRGLCVGSGGSSDSGIAVSPPSGLDAKTQEMGSSVIPPDDLAIAGPFSPQPSDVFDTETPYGEGVTETNLGDNQPEVAQTILSQSTAARRISRCDSVSFCIKASDVLQWLLIKNIFVANASLIEETCWVYPSQWREPGTWKLSR